MTETQHDSTYSWIRLAISVGLSIVANIGMWAVIVVLPDMQTEFGLKRLIQALGIPLLLQAAWRNVFLHCMRNDLLAYCSDGVLDFIRFHQFRSLVINDLTLIVGNVVVFEQVLANIEVVCLDLALRALNLA